MIVLNYSHPFTKQQKEELFAFLETDPEKVTFKDVRVQLPADTEVYDYVNELAAHAPQSHYGLSNQGYFQGDPTPEEDEEMEPFVVNFPGLSPAFDDDYIVAVALFDLLHDLSNFAGWIVMRPVPGSIPTTYRVAELIRFNDWWDEIKGKAEAEADESA